MRKTRFDIGDTVWVKAEECFAVVVDVALEPEQYSLRQNYKQAQHKQLYKYAWHNPEDLNA